MFAPMKQHSCTFPVPPDVQALMSFPTEEICFNFFDPTDMLVRLLVCGPLGARAENFAFFPENSELLYDFCHGARLQRMHNATPRGAAVLTAVIFFDEINRDQKGFDTGDGAIIVGGFFKQRVRESTYAKASLGTFPPCDFPKVTVKMLLLMYTIMYIVVIYNVHCKVHCVLPIYVHSNIVSTTSAALMCAMFLIVTA
jgi:hypothetical protein